MKKGRAPGPMGMTSELIEDAGERRVRELTRIFNEIFDSGEIPDDWKGSYTIPIFKGKGDALQCEKYRGVRLLEHGMKIYEKIIEKRLRKIIKLIRANLASANNGCNICFTTVAGKVYPEEEETVSCFCGP